MMTEDQLEQETLGWLQEVGYQPLCGYDIAPEGPNQERADYLQPVLIERLRSALARLNPQDIALVFIQDIHPTGDAEDQLKPDLVVMHHIRHRAIRHPDVAGDHRPAQPRRDQIAVFHARATNHPGRLIGQPPHHESVFSLRQDQRRVQLINLDQGAARRSE